MIRPKLDHLIWYNRIIFIWTFQIQSIIFLLDLAAFQNKQRITAIWPAAKCDPLSSSEEPGRRDGVPAPD